MCRVPSDQRQNLCPPRPWPFRTHQYEDQLDKRQKDTCWVEVLPVSLHPSIVCWKQDGRDSQNIEKLVSELVRCKPKWQNEQGIWRRDHVWVREHADAIEEEAGQPRRNNLVGRLLAIVTVHDPERRDEDGEPQRYSGAFVDILRHRNKGRPHDVHGLVEVEPIPPSGAENPWKLGSRRFYEISTIQRSAHLVAARLTSAEKQFFYINSYIDWDQYNALCDHTISRHSLAMAYIYLSYSFFHLVKWAPNLAVFAVAFCSLRTHARQRV